MPIGRLETAIAGKPAPTFNGVHPSKCGSGLARDEALKDYNDYPTSPRTMKYNNEGPNKHPSPVWNVAVSAP